MVGGLYISLTCFPDVTGPPEKEKDFYILEEEGVPIHHSLQGIARQNHMNELEKWEEAKV